MHVFSLTFDSPHTAHHGAIMRRLRAEGYEVMQVGDDLLAKIKEGTKSIPETLGDLSTDIHVSMVDLSIAALDSRLNREARHFVGL